MLLTDCKKASVYSTDKKHICDVRVSQITDRSALLTFEDRMADILDTEMLVTFYDNGRGLITYRCEFSAYKEYKDYPGVWRSRAVCRFGEVVEVLQRRRDVKVKVDIPVRLSYTDGEGKPIHLDASIKNISAGGVFVECPLVFMVGQQFSFPFLAGKKMLLLTAEVLRTDDTGYGCRFVNIKPDEESSVRGFVFQEEARKKRQELEARYL